MRRLWIAAAAAALFPCALLLAGCGGTDPKLEEPQIRAFVRELAKALIENDKEKVAAFILPMAGQAGSPVAAQDWDTPEGRERIREGNRRQLRAILLDAGIMKEADLKGGFPDEKALERLDQALRIGIDGKNASVWFDIAGNARRMAEVVTFRLSKVEAGWRLGDYSRDMVTGR